MPVHIMNLITKMNVKVHSIMSKNELPMVLHFFNIIDIVRIRIKANEENPIASSQDLSLKLDF